MYFSSGKQIQVLFSLCLNRCILMLCFIRFILPIGSLLSSELRQRSDFDFTMENSNYTGKPCFVKLVLYLGRGYQEAAWDGCKSATIQPLVFLVN